MAEKQTVRRSSRKTRSAGRPKKDAAVTQAALLSAALKIFAKHGLEGASMRQIARAANVDPALLYHYFDDKTELFLAAVRSRLQPPDHPGAIGEPSDRHAARLIQMFFERWGDGDRGEAFLALISSMATNRDVARRVRELFTNELFPYVTKRLGSPNAELRAGLIASQLIGLAVVRNILALQPLAGVTLREFARAASPGIAAILSQTNRP